MPLFENASGNNDTQVISKVNDETRHSITEEVSELSVPETHFDRQPHTHHSHIQLSAHQTLRKSAALKPKFCYRSKLNLLFLLFGNFLQKLLKLLI